MRFLSISLLMASFGLAACAPITKVDQAPAPTQTPEENKALEQPKSEPSPTLAPTVQKQIKPEKARTKPVIKTVNNHPATFEKIIGNSGLSLQWISWQSKERGKLMANMVDGQLKLSGAQELPTQKGKLQINGVVNRIDKDMFLFDGTIEIIDSPSIGRDCKKMGVSKFAITQNRKYFRLREFEWCDGLTDYIDIYF